MTLLAKLGDDVNVAVIGAAGGLGSAFVDHLETLPALRNVYAIARRVPHPVRGRVLSLAMDITDEQSVAACADQIADPLHVVIVATGCLHTETIRPEKSLRDLNPDALAALYAVNAIGPALVMKYFLPKLARDRRSVFAALSAKVGSIGDNQLGGWHGYRAAKAALNMMIRNAAIETARRLPQAAVIGVHPGTVDTPLSKPFQPRDPAYRIFSAADAAHNILNVMDTVSADQSGQFFNWDGSQLPF